jgi:acyl carrier protein phosphodiesterase
MLTRTNCTFSRMNYLAHAYLSFNMPKIVVGNMISDFVKGSAKNFFNGEIQKGIVLHRAIDAYTDAHPAIKKAKEIFRPAYRLYSGAIVDVLMDHYLANDKKIFDEEGLRSFTAGVYGHLEDHMTELPDRFVYMFPYMKTEDWLYHYKYEQGMEKSLRGLIRRAAYLSDSQPAYDLFLEHKLSLQECYDSFFEDVKKMAKEKLEQLL